MIIKMMISYILFKLHIAIVWIDILTQPSPGLSNSRASLVGCGHGQDYEEDKDGDDQDGVSL